MNAVQQTVMTPYPLLDCIFILWLPVGGAAMLFIIYKVWSNSRNRSKVEAENGAQYAETCYARFDFLPYIVRVAIFDGYMTLNQPDKVVLAAEEIDNIEYTRFPLQQGIQIRHHKKGAPNWIVLFSWTNQHLKRMIETHLHLNKIPHYRKKPELKKAKTGKKEFWPWLKN